MKNCAKVQRLLPYLESGDLTPEEVRFVKSHLQTCARCRAVWEEERRLAEQLAGLKIEPESEFLKENRQALHLNLVRAASRRQERKFQFQFPRIPRPVWQVAAVALVFLVGLWAGGHWRFFFPQTAKETPYSGKNAPQELARRGLVEQARILNFDPQSQTITLQIEQKPQFTLNSRLDDPRVRQILARALESQTQDGQRLRALGILLAAGRKKMDKSRFSKQEIAAICRAAKKDPNPGVRFKAIRVLENFPSDSLARGVLLDILRDDSVDAFRYEALSALVGEASEESVPILQMLARKDTSLGIRSRASHWLRKLENRSQLKSLNQTLNLGDQK